MSSSEELGVVTTQERNDLLKLIENWSDEDGPGPGADDGELRDRDGMDRELIGEGDGQTSIKKLQQGVKNLGYRNYHDALVALKGKPPVCISGTPLWFKYDMKFRRFFICDFKGNPLLQFCPVQVCDNEMTGKEGCSSHNNAVKVPAPGGPPSEVMLPKSKIKLFRNHVVTPTGIRFLKELMARERNTGSDELALLESVEKREFYNEEIGLIVSRNAFHSNSFDVMLKEKTFGFKTCGGPGCDRMGVLEEWIDSYCSKTCLQKTMMAVPKGKLLPYGLRHVSPEEVVKIKLKNVIKEREQNMGISNHQARRSVYKSLYEAGEAGLQIMHGLFRFIVTMRSNGHLQIKMYNMLTHPQRSCNNLACLCSIRDYPSDIHSCQTCAAEGFKIQDFIGDVQYGSAV